MFQREPHPERKEHFMNKRYDKPMTPAQIAALKDEDVDFSDIPKLDKTFWDNARVTGPKGVKKQVIMRLDADIVD